MIELPPGCRIVLASGSPRRRELLGSIGLDFEVRPADIDEAQRPAESAEAYVERLAIEKALTASAPDVVAIGSDTTVELDGTVLGKPEGAEDALRMLRLLSGATHHVHTGVAVVHGDRQLRALVTTAVTFVDLDEATIGRYVATGEPFDKAGAYAIQGAGGALVERVDGSVSNVIGLPLAETVALLRRAFT